MPGGLGVTWGGGGVCLWFVADASAGNVEPWLDPCSGKLRSHVPWSHRACTPQLLNPVPQLESPVPQQALPT